MNETRIKELIELIAKFRDERDWKQFHDPEEYGGRAVDRDERNHFQIRPTNSPAAHSLEWQVKR